MDPCAGIKCPNSVCALAMVLLLVHCCLLSWGAAVHSPTLNEPGHLVAGIGNWHFGRFDVYRVNPPLVRMVAAVPVLLAGCQTDWTRYQHGPGDRSEVHLGEDFVAANGERSFWLITFALVVHPVQHTWGISLLSLGLRTLYTGGWPAIPRLVVFLSKYPSSWAAFNS